MSRYIDADALIEAMGEEPYVWMDSAEEIAERNQWLTDMHIIEEAPSIDIVRCGECKKAFNVEGEWICNHLSGMVGLNVVVKPDDFCSYGEREGE